MRPSNEVTIEFVSRGKTAKEWKLVLVEEGPWQDTNSELRRLQDRLYNCLEAAIDGRVFEQFPESMGCVIGLQLDGYNLPREEVTAFWRRLSSQVLKIPDFATALKSTEHVSEIKFELNLAAKS